jgi:hypothetical protein
MSQSILSRVCVALPLFAAFGATGQALHAQAGNPATPIASSVTVSRQFETRAQLETLVRAAEAQRRTSEAWLLRSRLERGDFQEGDRIVVVLEGGVMVLDTLQVRTGKLLQFPRMGDLSLVGVLRSELADTVRNHLAKYLTTPIVRVTPLLPIAVLGNVNQPGYYYTPADVVLRDVIMKAGGPTGAADLNKVIVRRAGETIWNPEDVRVALSDGLSLDGLHLKAGDEVFVPERRRFELSSLTTIISTTMALTLAIIQFTR